jgi:hypothetical protein
MSEVHDRLDSWKAIAEYLDHDPTTVMRWAKERGLPVYVVPGEGQRRRAVYAFKGEIDAWLKGREQGTGNREQGTSYSKQGTGYGEQATGNSQKGLRGSASAPQLGTGRGSGIPDSTLPISDSKTAPPSWLGTHRSMWALLLVGACVIALAAGAWLAAPSSEPKVVRFRQLTNDGLVKPFGLATDGVRVYFTENTRDGWVVAEIPTSGGKPVEIAKATGETTIQDISPNRTELLLIEDAKSGFGAVSILRLPEGSTRRLANIQASSAAWSPGGEELAFTNNDGLLLCGANSDPRKVVAMSGKLEGVRWSPDGRKLCFRRVQSKEASL